MSNAPTSTFISAPDGLRLHARAARPRTAAALPVICLPGRRAPPPISTCWRPALAAKRRVIALDYRGRGQSDYDRNPANYSFQVEIADVLAVRTALDCLPAIFIGTSRGGILAMLLAAVRPTAIAGVVLNDIGPVIEPKGLMRIKGYVGKLPQPRTFEEGAEILRRLFDAQFPKLTAADWLASARRTFKQENGRLVPTYDVKLAKTMEGIDFEKAAAAAMAAVRRARPCAGHGDPRRQFRPAVESDSRGHEGAPPGSRDVPKCPTRATRRCWRKPT